NSTVDAPGTIDVKAADTERIDAGVTAASVGLTGSGGAAISLTFALTSATNVVSGQTSATVDGSTLDSDAAVNVTATAQSDIDAHGVSAAVSVAGAAGFSISGAGTVSMASNTLTNQVTAAALGGSKVTARTGAKFEAKDLSTVDSDSTAVSVSLAGSAGFSASVSIAVATADSNYATTTTARV